MTGPSRRTMPEPISQEESLTYADEFRVAEYLIRKTGNRSPSWLSRTMNVQYAQAARWLAALEGH